MISIQWLKDYQTLSSNAADLVSDLICSSKNLNLGCPTGNTPIGMYQKLVNRDLDWHKVTTYNLDEYHDLDQAHPGSYRQYMNQHLHKHANVNGSYFPTKSYDVDIANAGGLGLTILGLGHNGHVAFNEPGSEINSLTRIVKLNDETIRRNSESWNYTTLFPTHAVTMGMKTILASKVILLLVAGQSKLEVLKKSIWGPVTGDCPASYLQTHSNVTVFYCE